MEWMPISSAPKDGSWFYSWNASDGHGMTRWAGDIFPDDPFHGATHWMPLPAPPTKGTDDE